EHADNRKAENTEIVVKLPDYVSEATGKAELLTGEPQSLDPADQHRYNDRYRGYRQIVIELADWFHECPLINAHHQHAVARVNQRHSSGEQHREYHNRPDRQSLGGLGARDAEQCDLGCGVESQTEQEA